ncbi:MAG: DUF445 family protein [Clostridioides sp.]|jgi:uncharacterized membrane protein YheB (UPF0754 family)|nr:DUF445 family protein [Clostridioides sp.]
MNIWMRVVFLTLIGGIIGYITNVIAVRLLFKPIVPIKIPIVNFEIVGLIPKRRDEIASNIAEVVEKELLSIDDILDSAITDKDKDELVAYIKARVTVLLQEKLGIVPSTIRAMIESYLNKIVEEEVKNWVDDISGKIGEKARERIDIKKMVEEKINAFDLEELEDIILRIAKKELKHIEILGLVLGLIIGILQGLVLLI